MAIKDPKQLWKVTLAQIEIKLDSPATYKTFFSGTELLDVNERKATIGVANAYMHDWLKQKHEDLIRETISHVYGQEIQVDFVINPDYAKGNPPKLTKEERVHTSTTLLEVSGGVHQSVSDAISRSGLNDKYALQNFVVGSSNQIAYAAAQAVAKDPGTAYNPLFLHGKTGVGKTHLAQAVGRAMLERNPHKKVVYTSSEGFLNDLVKAIRTHRQIEFRNRYRAVNVLIIDDIQLISNWVDTQTEFFNTFNELYNQNAQIILICDRPPEAIKDLQDRLRSRFQGGIVVDVPQPELELRYAILQKKAQSGGVQLPEIILQTIARHITDNVRELEGALQKIALFNQMKTGGDLTTEEVLKIIGADTQSRREKIKVPMIIKAVSQQFGVTIKELKGERRTADLALARQVAMYVLREEFNYQLKEVAQFLNRSDHTTVMHAVDKIKSLMLTQEGFKDQVVSVIKRLQTESSE